MSALIALGQLLFGKLSLCSNTGALIGGIVGFLFGLVLAAVAPNSLSLPQVLQLGLMLALLGWIAALVVIGVWLRFGVLAIALPALINAVITGVLTVLVNYHVQLPALATLIGMAVGILVGALLCQFCRLPVKKGRSVSDVG